MVCSRCVVLMAVSDTAIGVKKTANSIRGRSTMWRGRFVDASTEY